MNAFLKNVSTPRIHFARNIMLNAVTVAKRDGSTPHEMFYISIWYLKAAERQYRMRRRYKAAQLVHTIIGHLQTVGSFRLVLKSLSIEMRFRQRHKLEQQPPNSEQVPQDDLFSISGVDVE